MVSRVVRRLPTAAVLALALLLIPIGAVSAASVPPEHHYRTLETQRVVVHFPVHLVETAHRTVALADEILQRHQERYHYRLKRVHVVISDAQDVSNGLATPVPYPFVQINAYPPSGADELGNDADWLRFVLTHELAHIVHLDQARRIPGAGRGLLGRAPYLFPNDASPSWLIEGLATYEETRGTAFGRGRSPMSAMVLRMAAVSGNWPGEDRAITSLDRWPGGQAGYLFGEAFLADLTRRFGERTLPEIARVHGGRLIPFLDNRTAQLVTGSTFSRLWAAWSAEQRAALLAEADSIRAAGLTPAAMVTDRGIRQTGPRMAPDGGRVAYTSATLSRDRVLRVMGVDGSSDRAITRRRGGGEVAWTPDGRALVYDELQTSHTFSTYSDLRMVDVATRHARTLTRGLRASDPDVSPDGAAIVCVRHEGERANLVLLPLGGAQGVDRRAARPGDARIRRLTDSAPLARWSGPRFSPDGQKVVASRWSPGGFLDVVIVDVETGAVTELTHDRAADADPTWTPDGAGIVFRSDRDGVPNLYLHRLADGAQLRVTRVLGGAFQPSVAPSGDRLVFSSYSARGYDVVAMGLDVETLASAEPFVDPYGEEPPAPPSVATKERGYHALPTALPRFWSPWLQSTGGELRLGVATGGADPLVRHAYAATVDRGLESGTNGYQVAYRYDRFRPTFLVAAEDTRQAVESVTNGIQHDRKITARGDLPLRVTVRSQQGAWLAYRRGRAERDTPEGQSRLDLGGLEVGWALSTARRQPYSISTAAGVFAQVAVLRELRSLGSAVDLTKMAGEARGYLRVGGNGALAARVAAGDTSGQTTFRRSFELGGYPQGALFDVLGTNEGLLRGYHDGQFSGRRFVNANLELRVPLAHPQRGWRLFPLFVRHLHAAAFADAGEAFSGSLDADALKTAVGATLGADLVVFHGIPLTTTVSVSQGLAREGITRWDVRTGLSF